MESYLNNMYLDEKIKATMPDMEKGRKKKTVTCTNKGCTIKLPRQEMKVAVWRKGLPLVCPDCLVSMLEKKYK